MSLLASILQALPGLGNAIGGFREGYAGGDTAAVDAAVPDYVKGLPPAYQAQWQAVEQAKRENERLFDNLGSWGGADRLLNAGRNAAFAQQAAILERAQQVMFEREKFREQTRQAEAEIAVKRLQATAPVEQAKVMVGKPGAVQEAQLAALQDPAYQYAEYRKLHPNATREEALKESAREADVIKALRSGKPAPPAEVTPGGALGAALQGAANTGGYIRGALIGRPGEAFTGRGALQDIGLVGPDRPGLDWGDVGGFGAEFLTNPFTLATLGTGALWAGASRLPYLAGAASFLPKMATFAAPTLGMLSTATTPRPTVLPTSAADVARREEEARAARAEEAARKKARVGVPTLGSTRPGIGNPSLQGL